MELGLLLRASRAIDLINARFGWIATWLVILACAISAGNAISRYTISFSSNAFLEIQWYMFAGMFMLGAPYTMKANEHVRVDIVYQALSPRGQLWLDLVGTIVLMLPAMLLLCWLSWPIFYQSWLINESSGNAGGLVRWPVKLLLPVGFALMALQGISEIIKRIAALEHVTDAEFKYEKPLQ